MAVAVAQFDTGHTDLVHDTQFDYYGRRLASCSSDGLVRVFSVEQEPAQHCADLMGHQGPVWQVAWAHPKFGNVLASASFDHTVIVWKEAQDGTWEILHRTENYLHTGSINSVSWAPHELGFIFAAASSDGSLSVHSCNVQTGEWVVSMVQNEGNAPAHPMGAMAVTFASALEPGALLGRAKKQLQGPVWRLASGGCDSAVRIWTLSQDNVWRLEGAPLTAHTGWVRDVAWAPNLGLPRNVIASAGQDGKAVVWMEEASNPGVWKSTIVKDFGKDRPVWSVSWSTIGNVLAISAAGPDDAEGNVELFKEAMDGSWEPVPMAEQPGANDVSPAH